MEKKIYKKLKMEQQILKNNLDCLFSRVSAVRRLAEPLSRRVNISPALVTISSSRPRTRTPPFPSSIRGKDFFCFSSKVTFESSSGASKSVISSLYNSRNVTFTLYSAFWLSKVSNICLTALGITPALGGNRPLGVLCRHQVSTGQVQCNNLAMWTIIATFFVKNKMTQAKLKLINRRRNKVCYLWPFTFPFHRVCFSCPSLTISEDGAIKPLQHLIDDWNDSLVI